MVAVRPDLNMLILTMAQGGTGMDKKETKKLCEAHLHRYVEVKLADGSHYDGIVERVDDHWLFLAVPGAVEQMRGYFPGPFYPGYGPYYPYPPRFSRLVLPLAALAALTLLPYYW
jgi:hypothetical protein